jgi:flagellar protein FlaI
MHSTTIDDALKRLEKYVEVKNMAVVQLAKRYSTTIERRVAEIYVK